MSFDMATSKTSVEQNSAPKRQYLQYFINFSFFAEFAFYFQPLFSITTRGGQIEKMTLPFDFSPFKTHHTYTFLFELANYIKRYQTSHKERQAFSADLSFPKSFQNVV